MAGRSAPLKEVSASSVETGLGMINRDNNTDSVPQGIGAPPLWIEANDAVLRGLAHLLSNRTGTIGAIAEALNSADPTQPFVAALTVEAERLHSLLRLLRLMPRDLESNQEPVRPADVVADAVALFAHHERGRMTPVSMVDMEEAPPVRVRVSALLHALLVLLAAAAGENGAPVSVRGEGADGMTRLKVTGAAVTGAEADAAAAVAAAILAGDDGSVTANSITVDGPAFVISLSSLRPTGH